MKLKSSTMYTSIKENEWFRGECKELCARPVALNTTKGFWESFQKLK